MPLSASLYIHVPFCHGVCDYCDFYSVPVKKDDPVIEKYLYRLLLDAEALFSRYRPGQVPTLYIGGGTPSALGPAGIKRLLEGVLSMIPGTGKPLEITLEANPESASRAFLEAAREAGATRLSLGVQSFFEASRRAVNRTGEASLLPERLALASGIFPASFSADLMSGLPFQTEEILSEDIERLLEYGPSHVSLYALSAEEGTPFFEAASKGMAGLPGENEADSLWLSGRELLEKRGFRQYEVSSFCPPGNECRHNLRYWRMESWLALGPAASATIAGEGGRAFRYTVRPDTALWLARGPGEAPPVTEEKLEAQDLIKESLLMGFRYRGGPDAALFRRRFGKSVRETIPNTLSSWETRGLLLSETNPGEEEKTALNGEGLLFLNRFLTEAFAEIDG